MADLRRHRINDNESGVPPVLWLGLALGGCIVIGFLYLFHVKNVRVQLLMTGATAAMIGVSFGLIVELDYPFRGEVSVSPAHWRALHADLVREIDTQPGSRR